METLRPDLHVCCPDTPPHANAAAQTHLSRPSSKHCTDRRTPTHNPAQGQIHQQGAHEVPSLKAGVERALPRTQAAFDGGDADARKEKASALGQVAMKLGQAIYEQQQASEAAPAADEAPKPADDDVVDAEFSEVEDDKK